MCMSLPRRTESLSTLQRPHCVLEDGCPASMVLKAVPFPSGGDKEQWTQMHHFCVCMKQSAQDSGVPDFFWIRTHVIRAGEK